MTLLNKILIMALITALALGVTSGLLLRKARESNAILITKVDSLEKSLKATTVALETKVRAMRDLKARADRTQGELNAALEANAAWATQRVPDSVFNSLFHPPEATASR